MHEDQCFIYVYPMVESYVLQASIPDVKEVYIAVGAFEIGTKEIRVSMRQRILAEPDGG